MNERVFVRLLADSPEVIPTLAIWYKTAWPDWFVDTPLEEIEADFREIANRDKMPFALAAFDDKSACLGVCSVRDHPFEAYPHVSPWLRGLYVHPPFRGQGVAYELIRAATTHAAKIQIAKLYASTNTAISTFERAGWLGFDQVQHEGQTLTIFATRTR
jgi:GNAT superfamily N-acetyltransferase